MPDDRYRTEVEYADPEEATEEGSTHHEESLDEYREDERKLVAKRERLDNKIESLEEGIEELTQDIEQSDLSDLAEKRDELQREVRDLRDETVELQIREDTLSQQLTRVTYERKAYEHFVDIAKEKNSRREAFKRLKGIVEGARTRRREKIKSRIGEEIQSLFDYFTQGTLRDAHNIEFKSGGSYHFEITTSTDMLDSSVADESTAEINLHALLFHTAILKLLSQSIEAPPLKLFVIDSPFANEVDERNASDIVNFISALPEVLPDYQVILASADTGDFNPEQYADSFNLVEFS
ncbi:hypothetical protein DJ78_01160 [Halorubrum ezzemoulense]|uniref:Uncharacterized protein n=2 Tax=Halorubrum ezzemoulense TaxID=337243 RepID=A0A256JWN7_HALEZ|nr:hypothetical protein DJ78_01160 [Halorubrum ezzemoulense]